MIQLFTCKIKHLFTIICFLTIQGCACIEQKPLISGITENIAPNIWLKIKNPSLFEEKTLINDKYQPLFEDHHPNNIGDVITVVLQENINASNSSSSNNARDGSLDLGAIVTPSQINSMVGFHINKNKAELYSTGKNAFSGKGSSSSKNSLTGLIAVTVQQVLPNGNLRVVGEKKVFINEGIEFIRFSGLINPNNINRNHLISSTQIADTHIEYLSHGPIHDSQKMGWLQKFLLKISPI